MVIVQTDKEPGKRPVLSFILCSRNDNYCGDSVGRLTTTLNYLGEVVEDHGLGDSVEVVLADWGSKVALKGVLKLNRSVRKILKFLTVPPAITAQVQGDSLFSEVHALNAAARRASGLLIGRIDQDTLVGDKFFDFLKENLGEIRREPNKKFYWCGRRNIQLEDFEKCSKAPLKYVRENAEKVGFWKGHAPSPHNKHVGVGAIGIFMIPSAVYSDVGGYDEKNIYFNHMEHEFVARLLKVCEGQNLFGLIDGGFYHLPHGRVGKKNNPNELYLHKDIFKWSEKIRLRPNGVDWGLGNFNLKLEPAGGFWVFRNKLW